MGLVNQRLESVESIDWSVGLASLLMAHFLRDGRSGGSIVEAAVLAVPEGSGGGHCGAGHVPPVSPAWIPSLSVKNVVGRIYSDATVVTSATIFSYL